jgi:hypothetical protein
MDKEKQRIKIAEACGWRLFSQFKNLWAPPRHVVEYDCDAYPLPDYLNDLNAMRKAESTMGDPQLWEEYEDNLAEVMNHVGWIWHASASERAEAFLRTLDLWEE